MAIEEKRLTNLQQFPRPEDYVRTSPEIMAAIQKGLEDLREGRVETWSQVKSELGL